jgi:hypothetical protein
MTIPIRAQRALAVAARNADGGAVAVRPEEGFLFRHARHTQALDDGLTLGKKNGVVALHADAKASDGEHWVHGKAGLNLLSRLVQETKMRETTGEMKKSPRIVAVRVDGFPDSGQGLGEVAETRSRQPHVKEPIPCERISWAEAQGFQNIRFGSLGTTDVYSSEPH